MPEFIEKKLEKEYPNNPHAVYGTMNKLGVMKGNKETAKGKREEKKHVEDKKREVAHKMMRGESLLGKRMRENHQKGLESAKRTQESIK